jgi:molecular chaperone DnaJ
LFEDIFGDFGFDLFGRSSRRRQSGRRGRDLEIGVDITLEEAASGVEKTIQLPRYEPCSTCQGTGAKSGTKKSTCPQCRGSGRMVISSGFFQVAQTCSRCRGQGSIITTPCPDCHGEGRSKVIRKIKIKVPAGVDAGSHLRIRGEGEAGTLSRGNLYVLINVKSHHIFERHNNDIICEVYISVVKAILGGEIEIRTLDGKVKMKIPPGTQPNRIFRLRDKGIPDLHGRGRGDELVRVNVKIPKNLTHEQKRLIEEYARISGEAVDSKEGIIDRIKKSFK